MIQAYTFPGCLTLVPKPGIYCTLLGCIAGRPKSHFPLTMCCPVMLIGGLPVEEIDSPLKLNHQQLFLLLPSVTGSLCLKPMDLRDWVFVSKWPCPKYLTHILSSSHWPWYPLAHPWPRTMPNGHFGVPWHLVQWLRW